MITDFRGKVAVITGAASGIGRAVALAMARRGADIVVADIDAAGMAAVCKEIEGLGRRALAVRCDVSRDADVDELAAQAISHMGGVDILMNNAGVGMFGFMDKMSLDDWRWLLDINLFGVIRGVRAFLPHLLERGRGYIVNTSSVSGLLPDSGPRSLEVLNLPYVTSKFGLWGFSETLLAYVKPRGITVSLLCPGGVATNLEGHVRFTGLEPGQKGDWASMKGPFHLPDPDEMGDLGDLMEPDEVARILLEAMAEGRFLILTHPVFRERLLKRGFDIGKLERHLQEVY
jgi:NAD(P)-dependent dehydrogenase (short-subunit alcohol dehydrogenase family)